MASTSRNKRGRRIIGGVLTVLSLFFVVIFFVSVGEVVLVKYVNPPFTFSMLRGWVHQKTGTRYYRSPSYQWRDLDDISPHLRQAVLAGEDQRFLRHRGFDLIEFREAIKNLMETKRIRGASTISMQAARSLFLWSERTLLRKLLEAYYTILIELFWDKERILEVYLNTVDWGSGVIGAEAAAKKYFRTQAKFLSAEESAALAAILPSPYRWSPVDLNDWVFSRKEKILCDMKRMPLLGTTAELSGGVKEGE